MSIAIFNLGGGGAGAALNITAYATLGNRPASAAAGAIAVITSQAIGAVKASGTAPTGPASGDVWVWTGGISLAPFAIGDQIVLFPRVVYQWSGSAWVLRVSYVYSGTAWVEMTLSVYDYGAELLSVMSQKNFGGNNYSFVTFTKQSGAVYVVRTNTGDWGYRCFMTDTAIDLTDITSVRMTFTKSSLMKFRLFISGTNTSYVEVAYVEGATGTQITASINVSALNGLYYLGLYCGGWNGETGNGYLYKLELIK